VTESALPGATGLLLGSSSSIDVFTNGSAVTFGAVGTSVGAWPTANLAIYVPIRVSSACLVRKLWVACGSTGTDNIDVGLYDAAANRKVSSGTVAKVTSAEKIVDVTDLFILPGLYYMGLVCAVNTATFSRFGHTAPNPAAYGCLTQALGSTLLPDPAVWAVDNTLAYVPQMGLSLGTVN
jgi:hypothetical protein